MIAKAVAAKLTLYREAQTRIWKEVTSRDGCLFPGACAIGEFEQRLLRGSRFGIDRDGDRVAVPR